MALHKRNLCNFHSKHGDIPIQWKQEALIIKNEQKN